VTPVVPVRDTGHLIGDLAVTIFVGGAVASQRDEDMNGTVSAGHADTGCGVNATRGCQCIARTLAKSAAWRKP